jgi:REP element-mobilizing transposase RayT
MAVRRTIHESEGIYFITFTCARWLKLFELTNSYDLVYKWFNYLIEEGHYIIGYTIMPNHVHALIAFRNTGKSINTIVGNGKRIMAYGLVARLIRGKFDKILQILKAWVNSTDRSHNKKHEVFEPSFDWKECNDERRANQKLEYIHQNPCKGKKPLAAKQEDYEHSSARFYITGEPGRIKITTFAELRDIDLTTMELAQSSSAGAGLRRLCG